MQLHTDVGQAVRPSVPLYRMTKLSYPSRCNDLTNLPSLRNEVTNLPSRRNEVTKLPSRRNEVTKLCLVFSGIHSQR